MADKIIIWDIDGTKAKFHQAYLKFLNTQIKIDYGVDPKFKEEDLTTYNFEKCPAIISKANRVGLQSRWFLNYLRKFAERGGYASLQVYPGVYQTLERISSMEIPMVVITDRVNSIKSDDLLTYEALEEQRRLGYKIREDTILWYKLNFRNFFSPHQLYFADDISKVGIIKELRKACSYIILIEDSYNTAAENASISETNFSILLDRFYNSEDNSGYEPDRVLRISGNDQEQYHNLTATLEELVKQFTS